MTAIIRTQRDLAMPLFDSMKLIFDFTKPIFDLAKPFLSYCRAITAQKPSRTLANRAQDLLRAGEYWKAPNPMKQ